MKDLLKKHAEPIILFALCLAAYVPTFFWMKIRWFARDSYYSHGVLIPFVVAYLVWQKKDKLKGLLPYQAPGSRTWGILIIIAGMLVHLVSSVLRVYFTSGFSFLLVIIGLIVHFYGVKTVKVLAFPLFFMLFMLPLPEVVIVNISFRMKMFAAAMAARVINGIGILAVREGSVIRMPHAYVVVDDVCSGLRSLISLMALGSLFAYFFNGKLWKRILLFAATIPIAVIANMIRVVFLAFVSEVWGHEAAGGFVHDASGFGIFVVAFICLGIVAKLLEDNSE